MIRNPKQEGSNILDCRPQTGPCPIDCNQCFYNRPEAFYVDINKFNILAQEEVEDHHIVRMNSGHDSNFQRDLVIETAQKYRRYFFNTSIPNFDFPGPVVFTANPKEEEPALTPLSNAWPSRYRLWVPENIMFVRLRISASNLQLVKLAIKAWTDLQIPIVLTFMAYYEREALDATICDIDAKTLNKFSVAKSDYYTWKTRHINSYYCPTKEFIAYVLKEMKMVGGRLVTLCGTLDSNYCRDCKNCENYYYQTVKQIKEVGEGR